MPITLPSAVETEIAKASLAIIDLFVIDFGNGIRRYWSRIDVPVNYTISEFVGTFESRVISIGGYKQELGPADDVVQLTLGDADRKIRELSVKFGINIFEGAKVTRHRLFPDVNMSISYAPGEGGAIKWEEDVVIWPVTFGINALKRRSLRRIQFTCSHIYGGPDCGADLNKARGSVQVKGFATATAGTSNTDFHDSSGPFTNAKAGWYIQCHAKNVYAHIDVVVSSTQLKISGVIAGEGGTATFASGDAIRFGPAFTSCPKIVNACKERYRYGPHRQDTVGLGDKRRAYGGFPPPANVAFSGRIPRGSSSPEAGDRFTRRSIGNDSLDGNVIPVVFGPFRIRDVTSLQYAPAGDFQHGLFVICEGEIFDILQPIVSGKPHDDVRSDATTDIKRARHDSFIKWGTWFPNGVEDSRIVDAETGAAVRRAVGRRASVAGATGNVILDAYGYGIDSEGVSIGNPYLFFDGDGDGGSLHGTGSVRVRIETNEDSIDALVGVFDVWGLLTPLQDGISHNAGDRQTFDFTYDNKTYRYTERPNPIQAAYAFTIDNRWGIGHPPTKIKDTTDPNDFCEELISSVASDIADIAGTVISTSADVVGGATRIFVLVADLGFPSGTLDDREITFNTGTNKEFMAFITKHFSLVRERQFPVFTGGGRRIDINGGPTIEFDTNHALLILDRPFPSGKTPASGDPYVISGASRTPRFKAVGAIADNKPAGEMLQDILDNANATFRHDGENIEYIVRRGLNNAEIAAVEARGIFTDRGDDPNIIRDERGKSSFILERKDPKQLPNEFNVRFWDREREYLATNVQVISEEAQIRAAKRFGEIGDRRKQSESVSLTLTATRDQAARLLALRAREIYIQNMFCTFQTSVKSGLPVLVGDIIAIDSEMFSMIDTSLSPEGVLTPQGNLLFRVLRKIEEPNSFVYTFECQVHINGIYDDTATEFGEFFVPTETFRSRGGIPADVKPLAASETIQQGSGGEPQSIINVKITWPKA